MTYYPFFFAHYIFAGKEKNRLSVKIFRSGVPADLYDRLVTLIVDGRCHPSP